MVFKPNSTVEFINRDVSADAQRLGWWRNIPPGQKYLSGIPVRFMFYEIAKDLFISAPTTLVD